MYVGFQLEHMLHRLSQYILIQCRHQANSDFAIRTREYFLNQSHLPLKVAKSAIPNEDKVTNVEMPSSCAFGQAAFAF